MKKALRNIIVFLLIAAVCVSLSSCNVFRTMRENAERASMIEILESPDDAEAAKKWLNNGAQPTETVAKLFKQAGIEK